MTSSTIEPKTATHALPPSLTWGDSSVTSLKRKLNISSVVGLVSVTFFVCGCDRASTSIGQKPEWVDPNKLAAGPIHHSSLTDEQMERIRRIQKIFDEVDPSPLEKWVEDFKRDVNPERELNIWESMATAFATFTATKALALDAKKEVFQVVLLRSGTSEDEVLKHLTLKVLTESDAKEIMALFTGKPEPIRVVAP